MLYRWCTYIVTIVNYRGHLHLTEDTTVTEEVVESESKDLGKQRFRRKGSKAKSYGQEATHGATKNLLRRVVHPTSIRLGELLEDTNPGRTKISLRLLRDVNTYLASYIGCKTILDGLTQSNRSLASIQSTIGLRLETELKLKQLKKNDRKRFNRVLKRANNSGSYKYRHAVITHAIGVSEDFGDWDTWTTSDKIHVGAKILEALIEATGIVSIDYTYSTRGGKPKTTLVLVPNPSVLEAIRTADMKCEVLEPWLMPMVSNPMPWTTPFSGGYYGHELTLVKTKNADYLEQLQWYEMPVVYRAINALQDTSYRVNKRVLDVAIELWNGQGNIAGLPSREDEQLPPKPEDIADNKQALREWKWNAREIYDINARRKSKTVATSLTIWLARKFVEHKRIWFPFTLDWRGRAYAAPPYLNPQGTDLAKGLLEFGEAREIETQEQADWFLVHIANTWGEDKCSLKDRIEWVHKNSDRIMKTVEDPFNDMWWTEADKPWSFLSACMEYSGFKVVGMGFRSRLIVSMDGTANGLQHLSAALLDKKAAGSVNMLDIDTPQDLYQVVCDEVIKRCNEDTDNDYAVAWLNSKLLTRKCVKRQVMTKPYGATRHGMADQLVDFLQKELDCKVSPFENNWTAVLYLTEHIWKAINSTVLAAQIAMSYLQSIARAAAKDNVPLMWVTPSGFPILHAYWQLKYRRIKTQILGQVIRPRIKEDTDRIDSRKQGAGISPNWTHGQDAAHLMLSISSCLKYNPNMSFAMVHDSYGTHAADAPLLADILREEFVGIYKEDQLLKFRTQTCSALSPKASAIVNKQPDKGTLDIEEVLRAKFFFA